MSGFERRRQLKKDAILNAALELFGQFGFNKVSIAEIAKKASVSQVSIYNFFGSKENLRIELVKKITNDHYMEVNALMNSDDPFILKFEKFLKLRIAYFKNFTVRFILEAMSNDTFIRENVVGEDFKKLRNDLMDLFEEGKREGIFNEAISSNAMSYYVDIFQSYFINNPDEALKFGNDPEFASEIISLIFNSFLKK